MIKVDTLELPESMRGQSMKLVPSGTSGFELYDMEDSLLLRGTVGEVAIVDLGGGENLSLFVSALQGEQGPGLLDPTRRPAISSIQSLAGQSQGGRAGDWSGILEISVTGTDPKVSGAGQRDRQRLRAAERGTQVRRGAEDAGVSRRATPNSPAKHGRGRTRAK